MAHLHLNELLLICDMLLNKITYCLTSRIYQFYYSSRQMQVLDFVNGLNYALELVSKALKSFCEPLGRISWVLEQNVRTCKMTVTYNMPAIRLLGLNIKTLSRLPTIH